MFRTAPVAGTLDLVGASATKSEVLTASLQQVFRRYGCLPVAPPILEHAAPFLDRSGDAIRSRMYMFTDPAGRELCLRPELTIPTARLYDRTSRGSGDQFRSYYVGPAFRFDKPGVGRYRQFTQAGVELIGDADREMADIEVLAIAHECLTEHGIESGEIVVSDISFFRALIDEADVDDRTRSSLSRVAGDPTALSSLLERPHTDSTEEQPLQAELSALLGRLDDDQRDELLGRMLGGYAPEDFGVRGASEIAQRLVAHSADRALGTIPRVTLYGLSRLLAIDSELPRGLTEIAELATEIESPALAECVRSWKRRCEFILAFALEPEQISLRLSLRRGIDYYSDFVFEINDGRRSPVSQVCAGGRYDGLVETVSGRVSEQGVGFALGLERLANLMIDESRGDQIDAVVVRGGDVSLTECVKVASEMRNHGKCVRIYDQRRVRSALKLALRDNVLFLVVVGENELASGSVVVKNLEAKEQRVVPLGSLVAAMDGFGSG